jgi:hypothetical protein
VQGLRLDDIAAELQLTSNQVEQSLFAARNRLAEFLVFGARLDCDTLEAIDVSSLPREGKRALKAHLRSCASCRAGRPSVATGRVLVALLPAQLFGAARTWVTALVSGGAAPVAKIAAAAAAGAVAISAPVTAPRLLHAIEDVARPEAAFAAAPRELTASAPALLTPWYERDQPFALVAGAAEPVAGPALHPLPAGVPAVPAAADEPAAEEHEEEAESDESAGDEGSGEEEAAAEEEPADEELPPEEEPAAEEPAAEEPPAEEPLVEEPPAEEPLVEEPLLEPEPVAHVLP